MTKEKYLVFYFKNEDKVQTSMPLHRVREDVSEANVKAVMDLMVEKKALIVKGKPIVEAVSARLVDTSIEAMDLIIE